MDRCGNCTEMLHSTPGTTLIWVAVRTQHSSAISSVLASEGHWCITEPFSSQTMRVFVKYKHPRQLLRYPILWLIKVCCPLPLTRAPATTPLRTDASPSRLILA